MNSQTQHDRDRDTGMALALLLLIGYSATGQRAYVAAAGLVLIAAMTVPAVLRPLAIAWFGLSHVLGAVMSRVIMTLIFFVVVTPVGVIRRVLGNDSMRLREFRRGSGSVLVVRDHHVDATDLTDPY